MQVLVIRHGIAFNRDPLQWPDDRQRPLTPAGERKLQRLARGLSKEVASVDVLLSSPWKRAWQTAELLHQKAGWPAPEECEALQGDRSPNGVLSVLRDHAEAETVALVGHEPQTQQIVSYLLTGDAARVSIEMKKGSVAALLFDGPPRAGTARLLWVAPPRLLREPE